MLNDLVLQELCCEKHPEVQEGFVHFFPALLSQLPPSEQPALFQLLNWHLSREAASWRCRIGLAQQVGKLAEMQVIVLLLVHRTLLLQFTQLHFIR